MQNRQERSFSIIIPLSAIALTGLLLLTTRGDRLPSQLSRPLPEEMAVEHTGPLTLSMQRSTGKQEGIIELSTEGPETASVTVPSSWERREVRGASLDAVKADPPNAGYTRWYIPPTVTLSLRVIDAITAEDKDLLIHNISDAPLLVLWKSVDIVTGRVEERSILVKDKAGRL